MEKMEKILEECKECGDMITCPDCNGSGKFLFVLPCPVCFGEGKGFKNELEKNKIDFYRILIGRNRRIIF